MKKDKMKNAAGATVTPAVETQPAAPGEFRMINRDLICPDPNQPRKTFNEESLKELAESIRTQGIVSPLVVRLLPASIRMIEPDLVCNEWRVEELVNGQWLKSFSADEEECKRTMTVYGPLTEDSYQIIFGERRWRASAIAGLTELPCLVRELSDKDRFILQFIENHQRENLTALEEAAAAKAEIEKRRLTVPGFSPEDLAAELGMSRASMYERLKLTRLHGPVREALVAGKISTSVAGEVAKLPTPKAQETLLQVISDQMEDGFTMSVRDVQDEVDTFMKQLGDAPFDLKKENYFAVEDWADIRKQPEGIINAACTICRHRTGNMVDEFPDLKSRPNVCTNPVCYGEKCKAHWLAQAQEEAQKGTVVLTEKEYRSQRGKLIPGNKHEWGQNRSGTFEVLMGKHAPEPVLVATEKGLEKFYPKEEAVAAARKNGVKFRANSTPEDAKQAEADRKKAGELREKRKAFASTLVPKLAQGIMGLKDNYAWELLVQYAEDYTYGTVAGLAEMVKGNRAVVCAKILARHLSAVTDYETGEWNEDVVGRWKKLGVDLVAAEKTAEMPLPLAKAEPKQKDLLAVPAKKKSGKLSAHAKANIIAAQKARWAKIKAAKNT